MSCRVISKESVRFAIKGEWDRLDFTREINVHQMSCENGFIWIAPSICDFAPCSSDCVNVCWDSRVGYLVLKWTWPCVMHVALRNICQVFTYCEVLDPRAVSCKIHVIGKCLTMRVLVTHMYLCRVIRKRQRARGCLPWLALNDIVSIMAYLCNYGCVAGEEGYRDTLNISWQCNRTPGDRKIAN